MASGFVTSIRAFGIPKTWSPMATKAYWNRASALCVEAYIGEVGGRDGIKLENQLLVTETGYELLTHYPFDNSFLHD
ncbi:metallopeptidase-like protein [Pseudomonas putida S11]|nr:metallopeptidase-like protein [Pseudomonas putida S11]